MKVIERWLTFADSVFYVGRNEVVVDLTYDGETGFSFYDCSIHGKRNCPHIRAIRRYIHGGSK